MPGRFHFNPQAPDPIYRQLMAQVRRLIASGQLAEGDELPSVRAIAAAHAVNAMTVSKAYAMLEAEGVLQRNRGAAMTVAAAGQQSAEPQALIAPAIAQLVEQARQLRLTPEQVLEAVAAQFNTKNSSQGEAE
ncbi:MAG: GntR family transcriptional regulator [Proteobacteria bacterium]|nr:GntR family transcriptional regulator [Pseudomonadota bacterium]